MSKKTFIKSGESRETSKELMEAILEVADGDTNAAEQIWANGATEEQTQAIAEIVTCDGSQPSDFCWGEAGFSWSEPPYFN